jgi:hypothetical protein
MKHHICAANGFRRCVVIANIASNKFDTRLNLAQILFAACEEIIDDADGGAILGK